MRQTAVVICPGRGTYNAPELGYLHRHHADRAALIAGFDARRRALGQEPLADLDGAEKFAGSRHTRGDNASGLIYAAALCDALSIHDNFDIVGVTGNSMGWYIALAVAGVLAPQDGFEVVNTMGTLMQERMIGGQTLYPFVDEDWRETPGLRATMLDRIAEIDARAGHHLAVSIHLGGMLVVAGNDAGLAAFEESLPPRDGRYPMRLPNHAAFHTPLQAPVAAEGQAALPETLFAPPRVPLVDGRGQVWFPKSCPPGSLRDYTLGAQVTEPYNLTCAVQVAARTFAPDVFIITGPGNTLGGAVAQSLLFLDWQDLGDKHAFQARQNDKPILLSMGREGDRVQVLNGMR